MIGLFSPGMSVNGSGCHVRKYLRCFLFEEKQQYCFFSTVFHLFDLISLFSALSSLKMEDFIR